MAATFEKVSVRLRGNAVPIDKRFLDALALMRFGEKYEDDEVKAKTRALVADLVGPGDKPPHPLDAHYLILKALLPKSKAALLS